MQTVYKTVIHLEILHEGSLPNDLSLTEVAYECAQGSWMGDWDISFSVPLTEDELLAECGRKDIDPEWFGRKEVPNAVSYSQDTASD